jgi:hypothetical protein
MPGRKLSSVAWDDLPGKWLAISTPGGGSLGRIKSSFKIFSEVIANPLVIKNQGGTNVFRVDRVMTVTNMGLKEFEKYVFDVYDTVEDMRDDVMLALLAKDGLNRPSVALIVELPEHRQTIGVEEWISNPAKPRRYCNGFDEKVY